MSVFIIAEIGSTHDGSIGIAKNSIKVAAECGVDAVKFQTHIAEYESIPNAPNPPLFKEESRIDYFKRTTFSVEGWKELKHCAEKHNVTFLSSVFSHQSVDLLEEVEVECYKIPSGEVTNIPLIEYVARTDKPVLLSSGMSSWRELNEAVDTLRKWTDRITILQCSSIYPCRYEEVGLNIIGEMRKKYLLPVGLSDHTLTNYASFAAVALGVTVIEKHFTLSKNLYGSDAAHSVDPNGFMDLVEGVRAIESIMSHNVDKDNIERYAETKLIYEKSIVATKNISVGETLTKAMLTLKKPGTGLPARFLERIIGIKTIKKIALDEVLTYASLGLKDEDSI